jgi:hypothetical protein
MRRLPLIAILSAGLAGMAGIATGCSGDDACPDAGAKPTDATSDATERLDGAAGDAGPPIETGAPIPRFSLDATAPVSSIRLANWSPDAPAVDFCVAPHGTSVFHGPLLSAGAAAIVEAGMADAGTTSLAFPLVSAYLPIPPGQYDVRLVAGGSTDCSAMIIPDTTTLPPLGVGGAVTFALIGATQPQGSEPSLGIVGFPDDLGTPNGVAMRVINASIDLPNIDFGVANVYQPPFLGIRFGNASAAPDAGPPEASTEEASAPETSTPDASNLDASLDGPAPEAAPPPPMTDPNGYYSPETLSGATLTARGTGLTAPAAVATGVTVAPGVDLTIAVLGLGPSVTDASASTVLLECVDNAGTVGLSGDCTIISH